jgi:hypothetical protein
MMMDTAIQQQTDSNGQTIVTQHERQALIQKLQSKWPLELSKRIENQAYEKSRGVKNNYVKFVQLYYHQVQTALQNRANQQQPMNNTMTFSNIPQPQPTPAPIVNQIPMPRFPLVQQSPRMTNPQGNILNRLREPQKFNSTSMNTLSYSQSPATTTTTTIDLSQSYSSQQITNSNQNDYSSLQPRYPIQPSMNLPRQRAPMPTNNYLQTTSNNSNDIVHQLVAGNSSSSTVNTNNSSTGDQLLQRILLSNIDAGSNKIPILNRPTPPPTTTVMQQLTRSTNSNLNNSTNPLRSSQQLPPSPSVVIIPTPTQTSTVQIQPSNNITIQQSPLNNSNGPFSANSQLNSSTPVFSNHSSPINRTLPLPGIGNISSPDDETLNLIKSLRENINRLQLLTQKFTNEGNNDKLRQVQSIHQQIVQFINNPTYETLTNAKHFRDMLERIPVNKFWFFFSLT